MGITIGDIFYGAAVIYALYQAQQTVVPQEFLDRMKKFTGLKGNQVSLEGAMDVYEKSTLEETAGKEFFERNIDYITGKKRIEYDQPDKLL